MYIHQFITIRDISDITYYADTYSRIDKNRLVYNYI